MTRDTSLVLRSIQLFEQSDAQLRQLSSELGVAKSNLIRGIVCCALAKLEILEEPDQIKQVSEWIRLGQIEN